MQTEFERQMRETNERLTQRTGRPLLSAIAIGLGLGGLLLVSLLIFKELFMVFAAVLIGFATWELATALRTAGRDVPRVASIVASVAIIPASFYWLDAGHWLITLAAIGFVTLWRIAELLRPSHRTSVRAVLLDLGAGALVLLYVAFLGTFAVLLTAQDGGQWWTLAFLIIVVAVDTGAYASGRIFGRHLMAPNISPAKTWEGFAGSALVAIVAGVLLAIFMLQQPWWVGAIFGIVMLLTGTAGDLAESLIKRDLGVKDMSSWLPGHGGFLDRLDSILLSAGAAYAVFLIFT
jgi:phosphatidate cytidylyltransferase